MSNFRNHWLHWTNWNTRIFTVMVLRKKKHGPATKWQLSCFIASDDANNLKKRSAVKFFFCFFNYSQNNSFMIHSQQRCFHVVLLGGRLREWCSLFIGYFDAASTRAAYFVVTCCLVIWLKTFPFRLQGASFFNNPIALCLVIYQCLNMLP